MNIQQISIRNIRSIQKQTIKFSKNTNLIYGKNGSGKTSILEAIFLLCYTKTFRFGGQHNLITANKKTMSTKGVFFDTNDKKIIVTHNKLRDEKKITINNKEIKKTSEVLGEIPCVVLSPEDSDIVSGPNNNRLKYVDKILSTTNKKYLNSLIKYQKTLKHRNKLLKNKTSKEEIVAWGEQLAEPAIEIWKQRDLFFKTYENQIQNQYKKLELPGDIKITYKRLKIKNITEYKHNINKTYKKDVMFQNTTTGPHKDNIEMFWGEKDMRKEASQGEKKLFLIALKNSEAHYFYKELNKKPIILLDDLFAKLDSTRCIKVISLLHNNFQTIITSTDNTVEPIINDIHAHTIQLKAPKLCFAA